MSGFAVVGWYGLAAPAKTQRRIVDTLNAAINNALKSAGFVDLLTKQGLDPVGGTPEEAAQQIKTEVERWTKVIQGANIRPN